MALLVERPWNGARRSIRTLLDRLRGPSLIKRSLIVAAIATLFASLQPLPAGAVPSGGQPSHGRHAPNRAIVGASSNGRAQTDAAIRARGGRVISYYEPGDFFIVETPSAAPDWVAQLRNDPSVR